MGAAKCERRGGAVLHTRLQKFQPENMPGEQGERKRSKENIKLMRTPCEFLLFLQCSGKYKQETSSASWHTGHFETVEQAIVVCL